MGRFLIGINPIFTYLRWSVRLLIIGASLLGVVIGLFAVGWYLNITGNRMYNGVIAIVLQLFGVLSGFLLLNYPIAWVIGFVAGQPGGQRGPSIEDGVDTGKEYAVAVAEGWSALCFWISVPWLVLFFFDFRGQENLFLLMCVLLIPAIFGGVFVYPKSKGFRNGIYALEIGVLAIIMLVVLANTAWRGVTNEEGQEAARVEEILQGKIDKGESKTLKAVLAKARKFPAKDDETAQELHTRFVQSLSEREKEVYEKYQQVGKQQKPSAIAKNSLQFGEEGFAGITKYVFGDEVLVTYMLNSLTRPAQLCGLKADKAYRYEITGNRVMLVHHEEAKQYGEVNLTGSTVETHGQKLPVGAINNGWALLLSGALPGESVQTDAAGCLSPMVNLTPEIARAYTISHPNGQPVKIRLHASAPWTWSGLATLLVLSILLFFFIWGFLRLFRKK